VSPQIYHYLYIHILILNTRSSLPPCWSLEKVSLSRRRGLGFRAYIESGYL
jgi:hypothetical protein